MGNIQDILSKSLLHLKEYSSLDSFILPPPTIKRVVDDNNSTLNAIDYNSINVYSFLSSLIDTPLTKNMINSLDSIADFLGGYNSIIDYIIDTLSEGNEDESGSLSNNALNRLNKIIHWLDEKNNNIEEEEWKVDLSKAGVLCEDVNLLLSNLFTKIYSFV